MVNMQDSRLNGFCFLCESFNPGEMDNTKFMGKPTQMLVVIANGLGYHPGGEETLLATSC